MTTDRARQLRSAQTDAEQRLWAALRDRRLEGFKFRRQRKIGPYIGDFVCVEYNLIVEADGGQHAENPKDDLRTAWLEQHGWTVIRFWNNDILANLDGVLSAILEALAKQALTLPPLRGGSLPLPRGGRGADVAPGQDGMD